MDEKTVNGMVQDFATKYGRSPEEMTIRLATAMHLFVDGTLYHGTAADPTSLRTRGIVPKASAGADTWAKSSGFLSDPASIAAYDARRAVFLTPFKDSAACFAYYASLANPGSVPHVVTVQVPEDKRRTFRSDPCSSEAMTYPKTIPAAWITSIDPVTPDELTQAKENAEHPIRTKTQDEIDQIAAKAKEKK